MGMPKYPGGPQMQPLVHRYPSGRVGLHNHQTGSSGGDGGNQSGPRAGQRGPSGASLTAVSGENSFTHGSSAKDAYVEYTVPWGELDEADGVFEGEAHDGRITLSSGMTFPSPFTGVAGVAADHSGYVVAMADDDGFVRVLSFTRQSNAEGLTQDDLWNPDRMGRVLTKDELVAEAGEADIPSLLERQRGDGRLAQQIVHHHQGSLHFYTPSENPDLGGGGDADVYYIGPSGSATTMTGRDVERVLDAYSSVRNDDLCAIAETEISPSGRVRTLNIYEHQYRVVGRTMAQDYGVTFP